MGVGWAEVSWPCLEIWGQLVLAGFTRVLEDCLAVGGYRTAVAVVAWRTGAQSQASLVPLAGEPTYFLLVAVAEGEVSKLGHVSHFHFSMLHHI